MTTDQLRAMLGLQAEMNAKVNPQWLEAGYPFLRAVAIEAGEACDHHGWKWWKAQEHDLPQLQMELVDIWHFALSAQVVACNGDIEEAADRIADEIGGLVRVVVFDGKEYLIGELDTVSKMELLMGLATARRFSVGLFEALLIDCEMGWDDLYRQYVGKNVLNFFRQDNGYKAGTYEKIWDGREDNEHLVEILGIEDAAAEGFRDRVYSGLHARYQLAIEVMAKRLPNAIV